METVVTHRRTTAAVPALTKFLQAALEVFGLGKTTLLFEKSFERLMIRTLFGAMRLTPLRSPIRDIAVKYVRIVR